MSQINQVGGPGVQQHQVGEVAPRAGADVPAELRGARPSAGAVAGRVLLGIFTLGISEGVRALVHHARAEAAPAPRVTGANIPQAGPRADAFNASLADGLRRGTLPPAYRAALGEAVDELRARFGADIVPEGLSLENLPGRDALIRSVADSMRAASDEISPESLRGLLVDQGAPMMAGRTLKARLDASCAEIGYADADAGLLLDHVLKSEPELAAALPGCADRAAADALLEEAMPRIREYVQVDHAMNEARTQARENAVTGLARATGLSEAVVRRQVDFTKLENSFNYLAKDIRTGENPARGDALDAEFGRLADKFVHQKARLFASVDGLGLSARMADAWKNAALTSGTLDKEDMFTAFHAVGSRVDASRLLEALNAPAGEFADQDIFGLLQSLALQLNEKLLGHYGPEAWDKLGGDGQSDARFYAAQAMLDAAPGLTEALAARPDLVERLLDMVSEERIQGMDMSGSDDPALQEQGLLLRQGADAGQLILIDLPRPAAEHNESLAASMGGPGLSPAHARALDRVIADVRAKFGADCLPAGDFTKALSALEPEARESVYRRLSASVRGSASPITSDDLAAMLEPSARAAAAYGAFKSLLSGMAQEMGLPPDADAVSYVAYALRMRHPELTNAIVGADNRAELETVLSRLPEAASLLRMENDIRTSMEWGMAEIYTSLSRATGLPEADVRERLDTREVDASGKFAYLRQDLRELCLDAAKTPEGGIPTPDIRAGYQRIVSNFVAGKAGLFNSIEELGLSPELAAGWRSEALTNPTLKKAGFLRSCVAIADGMKASGLRTGLLEGQLTDVELFGLFRTVGAQLDEHAHMIFDETAYRDMGSDELSAINRFAREAFLDRHPDIRDAIAAQADRMRTLIDQGEEQMLQIQKRMGSVRHDTPEMAALQAEYASVASALAVIISVAGTRE